MQSTEVKTVQPIAKKRRIKSSNRARTTKQIGSLAVKFSPVKPQYKPGEQIDLLAKVAASDLSSRSIKVSLNRKLGSYKRGKKVVVTQSWVKIGHIKWLGEGENIQVKACYRKKCGFIKAFVQDLMKIDF